MLDLHCRHKIVHDLRLRFDQSEHFDCETERIAMTDYNEILAIHIDTGEHILFTTITDNN